MARHVITMHFDPVLVQLSLGRPNLEMLLPADCIFTQVVLMPEVFCTSTDVLQSDKYRSPRKQHRSCHNHRAMLLLKHASLPMSESHRARSRGVLNTSSCTWWQIVQYKAME